ncbi:MAG: superfamily helicase, partial [Acidobacteria bacterium]|nr:superfamily helicase [Acidobacteriota bacterium]
PEPFQPRDPEYRQAVAALLGAWAPLGPPRPAAARLGGPASGVAACPDLAAHLAAVRSARRRERRLEALRRRRRAAGLGMVPELRAILGLLRRWGYTGEWSLTPGGQRLRFIYNELDLLVAEALARDCFDGLEPAEMAALASLFTYEPRGEGATAAWPTRRLAERGDRVAGIWERLAADEEAAGLPATRPPEAGFAAIAYRWARGAGLDALFGEEGEQVGDFVRNCRQLIDLLRQMADAAPHLGVSLTAAAARIDRGVVAASGAV